MKKLLALLCAVTSVCAYAADNTQTSSNSTDPYVGSNDFGAYNVGSYGEAQLGAANSANLNSGVNASMAMRLDAGYKINSFVGLEAGFTGLSNPGAGDQTATAQYVDVSVKGYLPISQYFDLHGQIGMAYANMTPGSGVTTMGGTDNVLVGVGADLYVAKSVAITANDYMYMPTSGGGVGNTNIVMAGLKYDFK